MMEGGRLWDAWTCCDHGKSSNATFNTGKPWLLGSAAGIAQRLHLHVHLHNLLGPSVAHFVKLFA
jgi:hypothetical protein